MGLLDRLFRAERKIQDRIERAFGKDAARTPLELRREVLHEVEARIQPSARGRIFPHNRIAIRFASGESGTAELLRAAFVDEQALETDIRTLLAASGCRMPERLEIALEIQPDGAAAWSDAKGRPFAVDFSVPGPRPAPTEPEARQATLQVVKGRAEEATYRVTGARTHLGRLREIVDSSGQMVRRNDVVFLDDGDEINATVGRTHATLHLDPKKGEFRIVDDASRYGTHIFRENRSIAVPSANPRGVRLRSGDEIYLGRACLRFTLD